MKADQLMTYLAGMVKKHGNIEVDIITETEVTGQVEQPLGDVAFSPLDKRIKLVPEEF